ncbi:hypothetical protein ACFVTP_17955 [Streptomyces celluloflavus]|uniref:hypothetical protein n=1 Tax=Streptomyces celluloflavus TaxID=58344 RepID=UPI0036D9DB46
MANFRGCECNHAWPGQILHIALPDGWDDMSNLPPEDERHAIKVLFQLLDDFTAEREAIQGDQATSRVSGNRT